MNKTISVILPVYNIEKYIRTTIESVLNQTYKNIELIIIDDCSIDRTSSIIMEYLDKDTRIKFYQNEFNKGPGATRNIGITKATGYYLTFIDHDDFQQLDRYENMIALLEKTNTDVVLSYANEVNEITGLSKDLPYPRFSQEIIDLSRKGKKNIFYFIPPWAKIYKTALIQDNNLRFSEKGVVFDDLMFHCLMLTVVTKVSIYNKVSYTHLFFPKSITGIHVDSFEFIVNDHIKSFEQTLQHPLVNDTNIDIVNFFFYQLIVELIENTSIEKEKILQIQLKQFMKKHRLKILFNPKLLRRKLIRIKINQRKKIIRILGVYLIKQVDL